MKLLTRNAAVLALLLSALITGSAQSATVPPPRCLALTGISHCYSPAQIRSIYNVNPLIRKGDTGKGETIAIIVSYGSPTLRADLHDFDAAFGLPDPELQIVSPLGTAPPDGIGWVVETTMDVEWAHVMAPDAKLLVLTSPVDETEGVQGLPQFLKLLQYARAHGASVISQSWGATEKTLETKKGRAIVAKLHAFYLSAASAGITAVTGSGDSGTAGLDLTLHHYYSGRVGQYPASDPVVLTVGGTVLSRDSKTGATHEVAWNNSGGGVSTFYTEPTYQKTLPSSDQRLMNGHRGYPDVAYDASEDSAIPVLVNGRWGAGSGTSAGTPQWAGLIADADQAAGERLGDVHSVLYRIARSARYETDFHDITSGTINDPPGVPAGVQPLRAGKGWDFATGWGSPNAAHLVADLVKLSRS